MLSRKTLLNLLILLWGISSLSLASSRIIPASWPQFHPKEEPRVFFEVDHLQGTITIKAFVYPAHPHDPHFQTVREIANFWNAQSEKFVAWIGSKRHMEAYEIYFDIQIPAGNFNESGFFEVKESIKGKYLTQVAIVPTSAMPPLEGDTYHSFQVVGYAPANFIFIARSRYDLGLVGAHEMGHQMGMAHASFSVMASRAEEINPRLSRKSIKNLLETKEFRYNFHKKHPLNIQSKGKIRIKVKKKITLKKRLFQ